MMDFIEKIKEISKTKKGSTILFFGVYVIFFIVIILVIRVGGNKNFMNQEYEKGITTSFKNKGILNNNYYFDYKVHLDDKVYDYYGKRNGDVELFKYNNVDYYKNKTAFFMNNGTWIKCDNPYVFYDFIESVSMGEIIDNSTFMSKEDLEGKKVQYTLLISTNTINKIVSGTDTDYDEIPNQIILDSDNTGEIVKVTFKLDSYCKLNNLCNNSLEIELSYEMFGEIKKIDNPIA